MFRLTVLFFVLLAFFSVVMAAPISESLGDLEKRTTHTGRGTWFNTGGARGNCGWQSEDSDLIVAMSKDFYDSNGGSNCGQKVTITSNGKTATATMVDSCPGCGWNDLDMSPALFEKFASLDVGVLKISWHFDAK